MAYQIIALLAHYGILLVFLNVLVEQAGVPVPAVPTLAVAGALAANGQLSLPGILLATLLACLLSDLAWYGAGRRLGSRVMRTICRISLSPDSCVKQSELHYQRWRGQILLIAKFVPGLSTVAPPLVGAMGLRLPGFLLLDAAGSLLWAGVMVGLGYVFSKQIDHVLLAIERAGTVALELVACVFVLYILVKWWQRWRLLRTLRMARITVEELNEAIASGHAPVVVDVRSTVSRQLDRRIIPGAVLVSLDQLDQAIADVPLDRELVLYCTCPNEISAAKAAQLLMRRGYHHVRPLLGGLDAWDLAGYTLERTAPIVDDAAAHPAA